MHDQNTTPFKHCLPPSEDPLNYEGAGCLHDEVLKSLSSSDATPVAFRSDWLTKADWKTSIMLPRSKRLDPPKFFYSTEDVRAFIRPRCLLARRQFAYSRADSKVDIWAKSILPQNMLLFTQILSTLILRRNAGIVSQNSKISWDIHFTTAHCTKRGHYSYLLLHSSDSYFSR